MQKKTQTMQGAEGVSSVPLLYESGENENTNCNNFDSQNTSLTFYPQPYKEKFMGKLASFLAGVISGAVALGVTACLMEKHDCATSTNSSYEDEEEEADAFDNQPNELPKENLAAAEENNVL